MFSYAAIAIQSNLEVAERISEGNNMYIANGNNYVDFHPGSTIGVNIHDALPTSASKFLIQSSESFASTMSSGVEMLGAEFANVIEENFWDLVLR
ncbi:hypothetical protein JMN21_10490 [Pseudomonas syringae pv. actinidiae]|nr:hypothetical protein [Pseudomonas syringae pv. actinidiae]QNR40594.1 hypothetical protein D5S12_03960 [Pseudomonas syringae]MBL3661139.1 hypothetical protein [Pseudomonas syringae pv. actinidiae]OSN22938.1 hypothetical protein BV340_00354 [Pseudomonas syringae pv. actinidiae]OSN28960.1 hypothetical protein BV341_00357 [Pseudomonas syringae pv. actinidiae]